MEGNTQQHEFVQLLNQHQALIYKVCHLYGQETTDREDLFQEIVIQLWKAYSRFRGESKFSTWLYTIANTTSITFLRKKKLDVHSLDNEKVFEVADSKDSGFRANLVEQKSRVNMVNEAIAMLSPDDAEIITLFYKAEQNLEEISRILRLETNTVKVRLHRARTRLKEKMEKNFSEEVKNIY